MRPALDNNNCLITSSGEAVIVCLYLCWREDHSLEIVGWIAYLDYSCDIIGSTTTAQSCLSLTIFLVLTILDMQDGIAYQTSVMN